MPFFSHINYIKVLLISILQKSPLPLKRMAHILTFCKQTSVKNSNLKNIEP